MEKRWHARQAQHLNVLIAYEGLGLISGRTRNISSGGMFVELRAISLAPNSIVRVVFPVTGGAPTSLHYLDAMVVRTEDGGFGVMFSDYEQHDGAWLQDMLQGDTDQPRYRSAHV